MRRIVVAGLLTVVVLAMLGIAKAEAGPISITGVSCRGEWVDVRNTSNQPKNLQGFRLFDHNKQHRYDYESVNLPPGAKVRVWAERKSGGPVVRWYTGWGTSVWNNTGDRATLVNPNRDVVSSRNCDDEGGPGGGGGDNCHPSYSPCVPIASDVDCAGGSGNGPVFVQGPINVIGPDKYRLDNSDPDHIGCE